MPLFLSSVLPIIINNTVYRVNSGILAIYIMPRLLNITLHR